MKISNMTNARGNKVANQFIVHTSEATFFQSYDSMIVKTTWEDGERVVYLDETYWDYSTTTSKHRNAFLGLTSKQVNASVKSGEFKLVDLNTQKGKTMTDEQLLYRLFHDATEAEKTAYNVTAKDLKQWAEAIAELNG